MFLTQYNDVTSPGLINPVMPWYTDSPAPTQKMLTPLIREETLRKLAQPYLQDKQWDTGETFLFIHFMVI